jgi:hypothetical protein
MTILDFAEENNSKIDWVNYVEFNEPIDDMCIFKKIDCDAYFIGRFNEVSAYIPDSELYLLEFITIEKFYSQFKEYEII